MIITISGISYFILRDQTAQIPDDLTFQTIEEKDYDFGEPNKKLKLIEFMYTLPGCLSNNDTKNGSLEK